MKYRGEIVPKLQFSKMGICFEEKKEIFVSIFNNPGANN